MKIKKQEVQESSLNGEQKKLIKTFFISAIVIVIIRVLSIIALVAGLSFVAISSYNYLYKPRTLVVEVDIDQLVKALVKEVASQDLSKDELNIKTKEALANLEQVIQSIAQEKEVVVLNSKAVLATPRGADITTEIANKLKTQKRGVNG